MQNLLINTILSLTAFVFVIVSPQPLHYSALDLTSTPSNTSINQSPTITSGTPPFNHTPSPTPTRSDTTTTQSPTATIGTPSSTYTPSPTSTQSATATLQPLPAFTLNFPIPTRTATSTEMPLAAMRPVSPTPAGEGDDQSTAPRLKFITAVLVVLWLILVGFLVVFVRQLK